MCIRAATIPRCDGFTTCQIGGIIGNGLAPPRSPSRRMSEQGVHGMLIYCADYRRGRFLALRADRRPENLRCQICGKSGADMRSDFNWGRTGIGGMGYC